MNLEYLKELKRCQFCPWNCGVNRIEGETGVCRVKIPELAYTSISPVLKTFSVTLLGCSFRCVYCNAYRLSQYPDSGWMYRGFVEPDLLAKEILDAFNSSLAQKIGVKRLSFTGGEPSINIPYLEEIVSQIKKIISEVEVGVATNGFCNPNIMKRLEKLSTYINFEIKAFDPILHQAITGAPSKPVLDNANWLAINHPEKIRVFRTVVIPGINEGEIPKVASFIRDIDPDLPYRLVGFRSHFMLYYHPGPSQKIMQDLVKKCRDLGLENVDYSGFSVDGIRSLTENSLKNLYSYLDQAGCYQRPRNCGSCMKNAHCPAVIMEPWTNVPSTNLNL